MEFEKGLKRISSLKEIKNRFEDIFGKLKKNSTFIGKHFCFEVVQNENLKVLVFFLTISAFVNKLLFTRKGEKPFKTSKKSSKNIFHHFDSVSF